MPRLFIAIEIPPATRRQLHSVAPVAGVRRTREEQLHLTLHFLDDVDEQQLPSLMAAVAAVRVEPFSLTIAGVGRFPPRGRGSVLWAGLKASAPLLALHNKVGQALTGVGFPLERRAYSPHVTLARLGPRTSRQVVETFLCEHASLALDTFEVDGFTLFESRLAPNGSTHIPLLRVPQAKS